MPQSREGKHIHGVHDYAEFHKELIAEEQFGKEQRDYGWLKGYNIRVYPSTSKQGYYYFQFYRIGAFVEEHENSNEVKPADFDAEMRRMLRDKPNVACPPKDNDVFSEELNACTSFVTLALARTDRVLTHWIASTDAHARAYNLYTASHPSHKKYHISLMKIGSGERGNGSYVPEENRNERAFELLKDCLYDPN
ncbi:hypothetical protein DFH11DRAFT_1652748 [Phellopilus nigrolimitatus]|nr:hypothetical protein DFH11DRAFT_1652748 [Phellopilus nigrolimitatus]